MGSRTAPNASSCSGAHYYRPSKRGSKLNFGEVPPGKASVLKFAYSFSCCCAGLPSAAMCPLSKFALGWH